MAKSWDVKLFVKHLANGSLADNLCVVCLSPLELKNYESIFTLICKEDKVYCIADVLETLCQVRFQNSDDYNVCTDCFITASAAYKFYLTVKQTEELLNFYTDELLSSLEDVTINSQDMDQILYITLPNKLETVKLEFNNKKITHKSSISDQTNQPTDKTISDNLKSTDTNKISIKNDPGDSDSEDIIVSVEDGQAYYFKVLTDGSIAELQEDQESDEEFVMIVKEKKERKKRDPLSYINCGRCSVKYRFVSKLRDHMKSEHNVDMFYCKLCKITTEQKEEYDKHLQTHIGEYQCTLCNAVYKKEQTLLTHMEWHERSKIVEQTENSNICEVCGVLLVSEEALRQHTDKHIKKYTCYYCGRMYKGETALNMHIKKHENKIKKITTATEDKSSKRSVCTTCGKDFVDERSLLWHQRLHDNDKPHPCDVCGRRFVSAQRCNQHALCAHTQPAHRCPLCPALFHLRSMVNTHVKKVHLKSHKRRNRTAKYENVSWKTKTVPIEELSVSIQDEILELQAKDDAHIHDAINETASSMVVAPVEF